MIRQVMSNLAKRRSPARAAASKSNGLKGGHPFLCPQCKRALKRVWPPGLPITEDSQCKHECSKCKTQFTTEELKVLKRGKPGDVAALKRRQSFRLPINKRPKRK
jgi:hypothetical protein